MDIFLTAIADDDRVKVRALLQADPSLATRKVSEERLYESGIFHWLYVGDTALHLAAAGYRAEVVQLLLAAGVDANAITNRRQSGPLHYAADGYVTGPAWDPKRQVKTIRCLLEGGADVNAHDKNGATPLHRAVRTRCAAAAQYLLSAGADPRSKEQLRIHPVSSCGPRHWPWRKRRTVGEERSTSDHRNVSRGWCKRQTEGWQRQVRIRAGVERMDKANPL